MNKLQKRITALAVLYFSVPLLFAQVPDRLNTMAENVLNIFTGTFFKTVFGIILCGSAVAFAYNKDNEKIKKNALAIGIAAGIIFSASNIIGMVWGN